MEATGWAMANDITAAAVVPDISTAVLTATDDPKATMVADRASRRQNGLI
jgi:hypothetical protein